jgi:iron complex transport system substrate-binding protein
LSPKDASAPLTRFVEDLPATWSRHANELWASSEIQRAAPGSPASSFTLSLPDGTKVPKRIVSLTPGLTETLFALGVQSRIVGVSEYCDYPPEAAGIARVGSFLSPVVESVVALEPDLVLTSPSPGNKNSVDALEGAGINVAVVTEGSASVADVEKSILEVSDLVGRPLEGKAIVGSIESELAAVRKRVAGKKRPATVVVVGHDPLVLAGPGSYLGELVNNGGGRNIADELGGKWPRTSWEYVVSEAPEVVIDLSMGSEADTGAAMAIWSRYPDIPAVGKGRVHTNGGFLLLHPGPRTDEQAVLIARYLHPAAWADSY